MTKTLAWLTCVALAVACGSAPAGPVPIVWDAESCEECRMLIGEPGFAAQLQTRDGRVLNFDDPGCALRYLARERPAIANLYFHAHQEDTWLTQNQTAFAQASRSPMGYGLAAVRLGTPDALSVSQASQRLLRADATAAD